MAIQLGLSKAKVPEGHIKNYIGSKKIAGLSFWAKGHCASAVGLYEKTIKKHIREQNIIVLISPLRGGFIIPLAMHEVGYYQKKFALLDYLLLYFNKI